MKKNIYILLFLLFILGIIYYYFILNNNQKIFIGNEQELHQIKEEGEKVTIGVNPNILYPFSDGDKIQKLDVKKNNN